MVTDSLFSHIRHMPNKETVNRRLLQDNFYLMYPFSFAALR